MILIMGMPGAGKSVQSELVRDRLGFYWLSTGQMFRRSEDPEIKAIIESGALVADDVVAELVGEKLHDIGHDNDFLLDGFPRTAEQAQWLLDHADEIDKHVKSVLYLVVSEEVAVQRLGGRGRADDTHEVIQRRRIEAQKIEPTLETLRGAGVPIVEIDANGTVEQTFEQIKSNIADVYQG